MATVEEKVMLPVGAIANGSKKTAQRVPKHIKININEYANISCNDVNTRHDDFEC